MTTRRRIAVAGSAGNPPTLAHPELVELIASSDACDEILWVPSGMRPDKPKLNDTDSEDRRAMTELTFSPIFRKTLPVPLTVDYRDIGRMNTPTLCLLRELASEYPAGSEFLFATGADALVPKDEYSGRSEIETYWQNGPELLRTVRFIVVPRRGYGVPEELHEIFACMPHLRYPPAIIDRYPETPASSTLVRDAIARGEPWEHLVHPDVAAYIKEKGLYKT